MVKRPKIASEKIFSTFKEYSMAVTDEFAFDPTLWVDGVNTMDQDEFVLLLERELKVNALLPTRSISSAHLICRVDSINTAWTFPMVY